MRHNYHGSTAANLAKLDSAHIFHRPVGALCIPVDATNHDSILVAWLQVAHHNRRVFVLSIDVGCTLKWS